MTRRRKQKGAPVEVLFECGHSVLTFPFSRNVEMNSLWLRSEKRNQCLDCSEPEATALVSDMPYLNNKRASDNRIRCIAPAVADAALYAEELEATPDEAELVREAVIQEIRLMDITDWLQTQMWSRLQTFRAVCRAIGLGQIAVASDGGMRKAAG